MVDFLVDHIIVYIFPHEMFLFLRLRHCRKNELFHPLFDDIFVSIVFIKFNNFGLEIISKYIKSSWIIWFSITIVSSTKMTFHFIEVNSNTIFSNIFIFNQPKHVFISMLFESTIVLSSSISMHNRIWGCWKKVNYLIIDKSKVMQIQNNVSWTFCS